MVASVDEFFGVVEEGFWGYERSAEAAVPFEGAGVLPAEERAERGMSEEVGVGG